MDIICLSSRYPFQNQRQKRQGIKNTLKIQEPLSLFYYARPYVTILLYQKCLIKETCFFFHL